MAGDQLLEVDSRSLVGLSQERAADLMKETGQVVNLRVAKQGAIYHGLATLLNQPTPPMSRGGPPPPQDNPSYMSQSKSTPLLNGQYHALCTRVKYRRRPVLRQFVSVHCRLLQQASVW